MNDRLYELEARNERLFKALGDLDAKMGLKINKTYTVQDVIEILTEIAYGKGGEKDGTICNR